MESKQPESYEKIKNIGKGTNGVAILCKAKSTGEVWCVKQQDMNSMDENERLDAFKEAKLMEVCNHPNIVSFKEVYKTKRGKLCIVMQYADGGDLRKQIEEMI